MKYLLSTIALLLLVSFNSNGQITHAHSYSGAVGTEIRIVNLSLSGKKIMTVRDETGGGADTLFFYNLDYSFWKRIICPVVPGLVSVCCNIYDDGLGLGPVNVFYPSETLFNTDTFLEVAAMYHKPSASSNVLYIINENGTFTDSITNGAPAFGQFRVFETTPGVFKATYSTMTGADVYDLPGTLPCSTCMIETSVAKTEKKTDIPTQPQPNPSSNEVRITFTLPDGAKMGELQLFNTNGQLLRTYKVDDRFGFITLDNSQLAAGMYFYNIVVNGNVSATQKMVVLK